MLSSTTSFFSNNFMFLRFIHGFACRYLFFFLLLHSIPLVNTPQSILFSCTGHSVCSLFFVLPTVVLWTFYTFSLRQVWMFNNISRNGTTGLIGMNTFSNMNHNNLFSKVVIIIYTYIARYETYQFSIYVLRLLNF